MNSQLRNFFIAALALVLPCAALQAGEPAELTRMRDQYDRQARNAMLPILQNYARDLENLSVRLSMQRDANGARQAEDELEKVKAKIVAMNEAPVLASPQLAQKKTAEQNVIANPGFETGKTDGWLLFNTDAEKSKVEHGDRLAHSGHYCLRIRHDKSGKEMAGALQDLAGRVNPGDRVHVSAWVRTKPELGPDKVIALVALKDIAGQKILQLISKTAKGTGEWEQLSFDFIVPDKAQQPNLGPIHLFVGIGGKEDIGDVLVDDVYAGPSDQ